MLERCVPVGDDGFLTAEIGMEVMKTSSDVVSCAMYVTYNGGLITVTQVYNLLKTLSNNLTCIGNWLHNIIFPSRISFDSANSVNHNNCKTFYGNQVFHLSGSRYIFLEIVIEI